MSHQRLEGAPLALVKNDVGWIKRHLDNMTRHGLLANNADAQEAKRLIHRIGVNLGMWADVQVPKSTPTLTLGSPNEKQVR